MNTKRRTKRKEQRLRKIVIHEMLLQFKKNVINP